MSNGFTIEIQGLQRLQKVFKELPSRVRKGLQSELQATGEEWVGLARRDVPADRGRLKGSINFKVTDLALEIGAQSVQAPYMEFGTKRQFKAPAILGNYPAQFKGKHESAGGDPLTALTAWVKRKGLAATYTIKSRQVATRAGKRTGRTKNEAKLEKTIAFLIFRRIMKNGVKPHPFLFSGKDGSDRVTLMFDKVKKNIAAVLQKIV